MREGGRIEMIDFEAQHVPLAAGLREAFERVLESGRFILGPEVEAFEREIAAWHELPDAIGVSSGTDALLVALMALDIGPGDDVVTTPFSFFATAGCIERVGARPVFCDIEPATFNLDPRRLEAAITPRTKAILPVHLFGQPYDLAIHEIAAARGIPVIEDAAQAIGADTPVGPVGGIGALACFSFFPTKNLGAFGDAGMVTTRDPALAAKVRMLRAHGAKGRYEHILLGGNFRLDALQAALLRVKLRHLDAWTDARRENAARYDAVLSRAPRSQLITPARVFGGHVYHHYVVRSPQRDALARYLDERGIATAVYYPRPLHLQPCFSDLGHKPGDFPESEAAANEVLALPVYPEIGQTRIDRIASLVLDFFG